MVVRPSQAASADRFSDYPPEAPETELSSHADAESIARRQPDLVVLSSPDAKLIDSLEAVRVPVIVHAAAKTLDDSYDQLRELGRVTGHDREADAVVASMKTEIAKLTAPSPARRTLSYYYELDDTNYSATSSTFIGAVLGLAGL